MAHLSISLLGSFQVTRDGKPVTGFESAKERALLAFLAAESGRPHPREVLAELLWPERPPGVALANLRHVLANLRKAIADASAQPPFLLITQATLQFNLASDTRVDLVEFTAYLHNIASAPPAACQAALALRQGPFLEGFTLPGSPQFEEWVVVMAEQVNHLAGQALTRLANECVDRGDFAQAADWTLQQLPLEPWNEEVHQQLIWQLAMAGQSAAALHHYEICRRMLAKELGVEPQPATQALVDRIRRGEPIMANPTGQERKTPLPVAPVARPGTVQLPSRPPVFLGRAAELEQMAVRLADPDCRLLTVVGPGGMGKTLLAVEAARKESERFADGVWFVDLAPVNTPDEIVSAILRALTLSPAGQEAPTARLLAHLKTRQALLLLDNFEHLLAGAELLLSLLRGAPGLKLLVTSRARLHLAEEWLLPLGGLATPPAAAAVSTLNAAITNGEQDDLADFPSIRLFLQRMWRLEPSFRPTPADLAQIAAICRLLEGMPLAIELAAAWVRSLSLAEIAAAVRGRLELFTTNLRDVPARHRSMQSIFDHSWRLLDAHEQNLLRQLAVFRGGCTLAAAAAVTGATPGDLESLVDKSWLRVQERRFTLHELMRQYCAERLDHEHESATGEAVAEVQRRHCLYFAGMTSAEEHLLNWKSDSMTVLSADFGNLEAAWRLAVDHGDLSATRQMMNGLYFVAEMTGWFGVMLPFFEGAVAALRLRRQRAQGDSSQRQAAALLLTNLLYIQQSLYLHLGWLTRAQDCLDEMQALLAVAEHDAQWQEQDFYWRWADTVLALNCGDFAGAHARARKMLAYLGNCDLVFWPWRVEIGNRFWQMHMLGMMGLTARLLGDYVAAATHSESANRLSDEMGERRFQALSLCDIAVLWQLAGDYEQARSVAQRGLALSQQFGDQILAAHIELTLGAIAIDTGQYTLANELCRHSLAVALETGKHPLHIRSLVALARIERLSGHFPAARRRLEAALSACTQAASTHTSHLAATLLELGHLACAEQDWLQARQHFDEALAAKRIDAAKAQEARTGLAEVAWAENDLAQAEQLLTAVIGAPATGAATRRRAEELLMGWGLTVVATPVVSITPRSVIA